MNRYLSMLVVLYFTGVASFGCSEDTTAGGSGTEPTPTDTADDSDGTGIDHEFIGTGCPEYYEIVQLGTLGGELAGAYAINNKGWVTGHSEGGISSGYLWKPSENNGMEGTMIDLEEVMESPFYLTTGYGINDSGEIVGYGLYPEPSGHGYSAHPFYWNESTGYVLMTEAGTGGTALAINNSGLALIDNGFNETEDFDFLTGSLWTLEDGAIPLPLPEGANKGGSLQVVDLNDNGQVIGHGRMVDYVGFAGFLWSEDEGYRILKDFDSPWLMGATVSSLNNEGQIVGSAPTYIEEIDGGYAHPVVWDEDGFMTDLGVLPSPEILSTGGSGDISDGGIIVGSDHGPGMYGVAWVYCDGSKYSLDSMIESTEDEIELHSAAGVNNYGQIIANGTYNGVPGRPFLLRPVYPPDVLE